MKLLRPLLALFFVLLVVDGALRKWVFPEYGTLLFLLKDAVLWVALLAFAARRSALSLPRPVKATWVPLLLTIYVFVVLLQAFNPRQVSLTVSAIGLKAHLAYLPLVVLLPALVTEADDEQMTRSLWRLTILLYLPVLALGVYQFSQPPTAAINTYAREMEVVATSLSEVPRITGTFSYISGFTSFLSFGAFLSVAVLLAGIRWRERSLMALGATLVVATAIVLPMTGSRGPVLLTTGGLGLLLLVVRLGRGRRLKLLAAAVLLSLVVVEGAGEVGLTQGWQALSERTERVGPEELGSRIVEAVSGPVRGLERAGLSGYGVGSNHQAAPRFVRGSLEHSWLPDGYVENAVVRVVTELGGLGWLVLMALKGGLLYLAFGSVRDSRSPMELAVGGTAFCMTVAYFLFPVVFNVVRGALYWTSVGAMLGVWSRQQAGASREGDVAVAAALGRAA